MELRCLVLALLPLAAGHGSASQAVSLRSIPQPQMPPCGCTKNAQGDVVEAALVGAMKSCWLDF